MSWFARILWRGLLFILSTTWCNSHYLFVQFFCWHFTCRSLGSRTCDCLSPMRQSKNGIPQHTCDDNFHWLGKRENVSLPIFWSEEFWAQLEDSFAIFFELPGPWWILIARWMAFVFLSFLCSSVMLSCPCAFGQPVANTRWHHDAGSTTILQHLAASGFKTFLK